MTVITKSERGDLLRVARLRELAAKTAAAHQIELIANSLSVAARTLLEQMPRVNQLMPALAVTKAEALIENRSR